MGKEELVLGQQLEVVVGYMMELGLEEEEMVDGKKEAAGSPQACSTVSIGPVGKR